MTKILLLGCSGEKNCGAAVQGPEIAQLGSVWIAVCPNSPAKQKPSYRMLRGEERAVEI